jgi:chemotaxis protein MotB
VLRRIAEHGRIPGDRLTLEAFGHERPLVDPAKPGSQQVNKRVDIVVRTSLPEETRALLGSVAPGRKASR